MLQNEHIAFLTNLNLTTAIAPIENKGLITGLGIYVALGL